MQPIQFLEGLSGLYDRFTNHQSSNILLILAHIGRWQYSFLQYSPPGGQTSHTDKIMATNNATYLEKKKMFSSKHLYLEEDYN